MVRGLGKGFRYWYTRLMVLKHMAAGLGPRRLYGDKTYPIGLRGWGMRIQIAQCRQSL